MLLVLLYDPNLGSKVLPYLAYSRKTWSVLAITCSAGHDTLWQLAATEELRKFFNDFVTWMSSCEVNRCTGCNLE